MKRAFVGLRESPPYRRDAFVAGLKACGYEVYFGTPLTFDTETIFVSWNRYHENDVNCTRLENAGGTVLIAENGYLGVDENGVQLYSLARNGHNGSGTWPVGGPERLAALGVDVKPWRASGEKIVIRGQRGIGTLEMASPLDWHNLTAKRLRAKTSKTVEVHPHPGHNAVTDKAHEAYLVDAHALVIWSSSVGVKALVAGVPVFRCAPHWVCAGAALHGTEEIDNPKMDDAARMAALERMAWAQWRISEIESGEAFRWLLQ